MLQAELEDDPERRYTPDEERRLTLNLRGLVERVFWHDSQEQAYSVGLVCAWHKTLFGAVRPHAGLMRSPDYGEQHLIFGPHRSADRAAVPRLMDEHVRMALNLGDEMRAKLAEEVVRGALYIHAHLIGIHPFRDGNGRVGRLALSYWLRHNGLPPILFEHARNDYLDAMNTFYQTRNLQPLLALALRLYAAQL